MHPLGNDNIFKIYAESFRGADHLGRILEDGERIVSNVLVQVSEQSRLAHVGCSSADSE